VVRQRDEARRELAALQGVRAAVEPDPLVSRQIASSGPAAAVDPPPAPPRVSASLAHAVPASALPPPARIPPKLPGSDPHQFAGFWFFARTSQIQHQQNVYPPEFIEATITEQNGIVHGKYRSRYRIVDRAISPDVNFEFTGAPSDGAISCVWVGQGGARGQLTIRMTGENDLKVDWTASEIGSVQGLASGTATLTRRLE
jgi:hypothetical protein